MTHDTGSVADRRRELERRLAELSPAKRALFDRDVVAPLVTRGAGPRPRAPGTPVPMSFAQELLWLLDRAQPGMHGYNVPRTVRMMGALDVAALERALDMVVARHEVLRTTFDLVDGEPRQIVSPPSSVPVARVDLRDLPDARRDDEAARILAELARRPFDLATDLQLRATLIQLAADDHVLLLESHHVSSDAWSRNILVRELSELYRGFRDGEPLELAPLDIQYGDFAIWQRAALSGPRLDALLGYWRTQLAGAPAALELPTDRPHPRVPGFDGATRSRVLPLALLERLRQISQAEGATLFMTLLAAFDVLLARYSAQDDIVVGSPIAGREMPEVEGLIGYFANTLVLRARLDGDPPFRDFLARVRETALGAYDHQDIPYEKLVLELQRDRALGRTPLFQVMFTLQDAELRSLQLDGLMAEAYGAARGATKFDLSLFMQERPTGLRAMLEYRTDLFDADTIDRMLGHLEVLLEGIARDPATPVSRLPLLDTHERIAVTVIPNQTETGYPADETLHGLIASQAARTPDAPALEWEDDGRIARLTFAELTSRAHALAETLRAAHGDGNSAVAICAPRSPELVVAMLAVLESGGFYVPLDPEYPPDRLAFMLRDSAVRTLLVADDAGLALLRDAAAECSVAVIRIPDGAAAVDAREASAARPAYHPTPADLAYVIYTSGSTGQPKGVMIPHRAVVNYLSWMQSRYPVGVDDAVLQKAPASFDASIWEFFLPLTTGARLVLARPGGAQDPEYLLDAIERHRLTVLQLVPSQLRMVLETEHAGTALSGLRQLFLGGEALPPDLAHAMRSRWPELAATNLYGPTEATVYATFWDVPRGMWQGSVVPIGRPIANTKIYLLDPAGAPVPVGIAGELCIGGIGVGSGYLNRPELTAERFVADPFSATPGARMYRTGDRARRRADGSLEYLGRMDTQVKIRGFRAELGEIENALASLPEVQSAIVTVHDDQHGDQQLVAYCIPAGQGTGDGSLAAKLRTRLAQTLPDFMLPGAFVWLDAWPLNANGKLDRRALPAPTGADAPVTSSDVAPRNQVEATVAEIWGELLHRRVGVHDDIFAIGGHSLTALRALARISERFGVRIPLRTVFESPTIAELAEHVTAAAGHETGSADSPIVRLAASHAPLSHSQELLWLLQRTTPDLSAYNMADRWVISGPLDHEALGRALDALAERHEAFRTTFVMRDGIATQLIGDARAVPLEVIDLRALPEDERAAAVERSAREFADRPFDLAGDVLLRARLIRFADAAHVLVLVTHHVVSDGWSRGIVLRELGMLYDAARRDMQPRLAPLPIRYADFAAWQRRRLDGPGIADEVRYWTDRLHDATLAVDMPTDHPRSHRVTFEGTKRTVVYPAELLAALRDLAAARGTTLFTVLLAAFEVLLYRYSGQDDLVVGTVVAGRSRPELEGVVGYFANTVALRTSLAGEPTFTELLARVRNTYLDAVEHAEVPFEAIARELQRRGVSATQSFCQVMFVLQNIATEQLVLGDATIRAAGMKATTSKLDLSVSMGEQADGLRVAIEYRTDLYEHTTIARMLDHLRVLLTAIAANPDACIAELPLLPATETEVLLAWSRGLPVRLQPETPVPPTRAPVPREPVRSDLELIARVATRSPDAIAVTEDWGESRTLTYAGLVVAVERAAGRIRALGVARGDIVAVYAERSLETVVTLLAIQSAGAAYVPLDPANPAARIAFVLRDTDARFVFAQWDMCDALRESLAELASLSGPRLIAIDEIAGDASPLPSEPLRPIAEIPAAEDVAYVLYTSGSTGTPKGALIEHRNMVHHSRWMQANLPLAQGDSVLQITTLTFDTSVSEVFDTLSAGARVVLARPDGQHDPAYIADALVRQGIVHYETVPSLMALVLDELVRGDGVAPPNRLRHTSVGGEVLPPELAARFCDLLPSATLHNGYGPTETTIDATWWVVQREALPRLLRDGTVPIGGPIGDARAYVVDARGALVPAGVPGELWVGGAGVGRGYLNRPELTAERFTADPFAGTTDARVYRTGDRVRWLADGTIEFLGRTDHQVKIGGVRIELSEIEAVLASHPAVRQLAVILRGHGASAQLVGYVAGDASLSASDLRAHARAKLPAYMIPAQLVILPELPTMASGKIDRLRLPVMDTGSQSETEWVAPRTATEAACALVWSEVLPRERIGGAHSFFELGGNSLAAMRIVARVHDTLGVRVPLNTIFEFPTLTEFARAVDLQRTVDGARTAEPVIPHAPRIAARRPLPRGEIA